MNDTISTNQPFASHNSNCGRSFLKHSRNHVEQSTQNSRPKIKYVKPKNMLHYPLSTSSHSSKSERNGQSDKSSITKNSINTKNNYRYADMENPSNNIQRSAVETNSCSSNTKIRSREIENSNMRRDITTYDTNINSISRSANYRKNSVGVGNSSEDFITYNSKSAENNLRLANSRKHSIGVKDSGRTISNSNSVENTSRPAILKKRFSSQTNHGKYPMRVENLSMGSTIYNSNSVENNSRKRSTIEDESNSHLTVPKKRSKIENSNKNPTIHSSEQRGSAKNNIRTTNHSTAIENSNSGSTINRNGTKNNSSATNLQHFRKPDLHIGFDRFSSLNKRTRNKDLTKSEWENMRLIKAALINLVESHPKYRKIKDGRLVWSKINEWIYSTFYPDLNNYLDKKHINRENVDLVIKAIMDYYVSRHDGYRKKLRKED